MLCITNFSHKSEVMQLSASWEPTITRRQKSSIWAPRSSTKICLPLFSTISTPGLAVGYFTVYSISAYYKNRSRNRKLELFVQNQPCSHGSIKEGSSSEYCHSFSLFWNALLHQDYQGNYYCKISFYQFFLNTCSIPLKALQLSSTHLATEYFLYSRQAAPLILVGHLLGSNSPQFK